MAVNWQRWFRHLFTTRRALGSAFPLAALEAIERASNGEALFRATDRRAGEG